MEVLKYYYRKLFKLSAQDMEEEPSDQFFTNLTIYGLIQKKKSKDIQRSQRGRS